MENFFNIPWEEGEKLIYQASTFGVTAAVLTFEVLPSTTIFNIPALHFKITVKTQGLSKRIHNIEAFAESYINKETLNSLEWKNNSLEGKHTKLCVERHLPTQQKYFYFSKTDGLVNKQETRDFIHPEWYCDIFSFFYMLRVLNPGEVIYLIRNYESKPAQIISSSKDTILFSEAPTACEKLVINFDGKEHVAWRELHGNRRILKAQVSTSFTNGTIILKV
jgi:hypothetical protein